MSTQGTTQVLHGPHPDELQEQPPWVDLAQRLHRAERQSRWLKYTLFIMAPMLVYVFIGQKLPDQLVRRESLVAADRMQLFDESGNTRLYMRVYSGVPVVQLIDESGKPRLSLGLRYDDSPFISLADVRGQTRATLQVSEGDKPALKLFDENGEPSFTAR
jgi:hypothetical protein